MSPRAAAAAAVSAGFVVVVALAGAAELLARRLPGARLSSTELDLLWAAGRRAAFPCGEDGWCETHPELTRIDIPRARFSRAPSPGTFRVVAVGDSCTLGWPYHPRGGYPEWLGAALRDVLPGRRVEVLNLGVHGFDGERIDALFEEALALSPAAVLVRAGYNDYRQARLRRPPGGALGAAGQRARLFLLERSAAFRVASRGLLDGDGGVARRPQIRPLPEQEKRAILAAHRVRVLSWAERARRSGTRLVLLGLPHRRVRGERASHGLETVRRLHLETALAAREAGAVFVPLAELRERDLFVDPTHSTPEGYRLTALRAAEALAAAGVSPADEWRWSRLRPARATAEALGLDRDFTSMAEVEAAAAHVIMGDEEGAERLLSGALAASPRAARRAQERAAAWPALARSLERARSRVGGPARMARR